MKYIIDSKESPMDIALTLVSNKPNNHMRTIVYDSVNKDIILERTDVLSGSKNVMLKLPMTGRKTIIETFTQDAGRLPHGKNQTFYTQVTDVLPLKTYNVDMGSGDQEFMAFIKQFAVMLPNLPADGKVRTSPSGKFKIVIFDKLRSHKGVVLPSPCLVGIKDGVIEVSQDYMMKMSHSQRVAVLSHEYGHFYKNPLSGLEVKNEEGADLNGMAIYLGSGFGLSEYINAFKKVFNGADSRENRGRYSIMKGFARKIFNGEYFGKPYNL